MTTIVVRKDYNMSGIVELTRSRLRKDLFRLYFTNPDSEYYLRELERILGFSAANIRRDLVRLMANGLFNTRRQGNLLYYRLNKDHPLYEELKAIIAKTVGVESSLKDIVDSTSGIKSAVLYGSFGSETETADSDVDILIIGEPDEDVLVRKIDQLEKKIKREINYVIYSPAEYKRRARTKDSFIVNVLERPKVILKGNIDEL